MNQFLTAIMALGVLLGGLDRIFGNRFGLGAKFEEGFHLLGPMALSMAGITCLTPLIADFSQVFLSPALSAVGIDPAICGGILAIDTGGYPLAMELAADGAVGQYAGIIVAATFGCTVVFVIPVGMRYLSGEARAHFANGLLIGLVTLPVGLLIGGTLCGLTLWQTVYQSLPVLLISAILLWGLIRNTEKTVRGFTIFAKLISAVTTLGLMLAAIQSLTGLQIFPRLMPLEEVMAVISSIGIVMLGCMPITAILQKLLHRPICWIGKKTGLTSASTAAMFFGVIIAMPALVLLKDMDKRGRIVNGALLVCGASALSAHLGFTLGAAPEMVTPLLFSKLIGAVFAAIAAIVITRPDRT